MNSSERIRAAVMHRQPDRVPVDFGSGSSTDISAWSYDRLVKASGIQDKRNRVYDPIQMLSMPSMELMERFGVDALNAGRNYSTDWKPFVTPDGLEVEVPGYFQTETEENGDVYALNRQGVRVAKMPVGANFFDQVTFPYDQGYPEDFSHMQEDLQLSMWHACQRDPYQFSGQPGFWKKIREQILAMKQAGYATVVAAGCNYFETGFMTRRYDNILVDLMIDKAEVRRYFDALEERFFASLEVICREVGDVVDVVRLADDMGTGQGSMFSKDLYMEMIQPYHKRVNEYIHSHSNMMTFLHSCGSVYELLPGIIDAGYDILNPVQINAKDMQPEKLKREFGRDICFWGGGCDTTEVLPYATPAQVREHVLHNMEVFSKDGGFVFATVHNILSDVPAENILAMFDAVKEFNGGK